MTLIEAAAFLNKNLRDAGHPWLVAVGAGDACLIVYTKVLKTAKKVVPATFEGYPVKLKRMGVLNV